MEPDGILKGSTIKERTKNTTKITGKKLFAYSTATGSATPTGRFLRKTKLSSNQINPVITSIATMNNAKYITYPLN
jgi:hypothetical protein